MKKILLFIAAAFLALGMLAVMPAGKVSAAAGQVEVKKINYDNLDMIINKNGNSIVYFSTNGKDWNEIDGETKTVDGVVCSVFDISFVPGAGEVTVYLKGNSDQTVVDVKLPKTNTGYRATFDKVSGTIDFTGDTDGVDKFMWRKSTDYNWKQVSVDEESDDHKAFLKEIESLRIMGAKIYLKLCSVDGTSAENTGKRPGKEIAISVTKYSSAPSVKLNVVKLTFNTKDSMEYSDDGERWTTCAKNMSIEDLAGEVLGGSGTDATLKFRVAATEKKPCSLMTIMTIKAQKPAPSASEYSFKQDEKGAGILKISGASKSKPYEYCVISDDDEFELTKAKWKSVNAAKDIKISARYLKDGATIYIRIKGTAENAGKKIALELPSAYATIDVN